MRLYGRLGKRALDLGLAIPATVLLTPVFVTVATAVRIKLGAPVLFRHMRPGKDGELFEMIKFRTMTEERDEHGELLPDEDRLTSFGELLRRTSLDELPTLWNVIRGEMSLVGPRPLLVQYLDRYSRIQRRRHETLPGITGWTQVNGRNALSWEEKFELDVWYVDHVSLYNDLKVIAKTIGQVVLQRGITAEGHATMPEFMGEHDGTQ